MPISILMPALSPTMEEGTLTKWLVKEGDSIAPGDVIAEIETDKATMEVEAIEEGVVARILVAEGTEGVPVNQIIAIVLEEGEDETAIDAAATSDAPVAANPLPEASEAISAPKESEAISTPLPQPRAGNGARVFASPLARRMAASNGINISQVTGSGPHGRIVKHDVEKAMVDGPVAVAGQPAQATVAVTTVSPASVPTAVVPMADDKVLALYQSGTYDIVPHSNMRKTIARRLTEAKTTIPHFYLSIECCLDEMLAARKRLNDAAGGSFKLSVNDFIIKALALALQHVPDANVTWTEQGRLMHTRSDVGVAVAVDDGLFTPIIRNAELKTLSEISNEMKDLAARARDRKLKPHEYQGGTTSISNLGMYGIKRFDAVINPPHATILAVGMGEERVIARNGSAAVATMMSCTMSCDHRVVDGALGAELLAAFRTFVQDPVRMLV